ncbi:MAG TPA: molybdenum cofactor guanylyltransferase [Acidimicrobiales bacterium]|nr:molybdenum cofactor guanylyltransferase [Acidimicrobiales bacterium]
MGECKGTEPTAFEGAVLTGGLSRRMGRDKALLPVREVPMAVRVARSLYEAGATEVFAVGGDPVSLRALGLRYVADEFPHEGPLGGIISALRAGSGAAVVVCACDMPWIRPEHVVRLVLELGRNDAVLSADNGQLQPLHAVWSHTALEKLERAFRRGERSPQRAVGDLRFKIVDLGGGSWSSDVDTPEEVASIDPPQN